MGNVDSFRFAMPDDNAGKVHVVSGEVFIKLPRGSGASTDAFEPGYVDTVHNVSHLHFHDDLLI